MNIVAVTACPTGIAHCELAAERLRSAMPPDVEFEVEVRGAGGPKKTLEAGRIESADVAILAADVRIDTERFADVPTFRCSTDDAIRDTEAVLRRARELAAD